MYEKDLAAGDIKLGSVEGQNGWRRMYLVLLAESDSEPTETPPAPAGWTAPRPNRTCSSWVHDLNTTDAPNCETYVGWHPQIDPVYWCYFGHEHGSDPSIIPGNPLVGYGYVASHVPQNEPHRGFREFIMESPDGDHWLRFIIHAGTSAKRRICHQFHTLFVMVYDKSGNEKFSVGFKNDYGAKFDTVETVFRSPALDGVDKPCRDSCTAQLRRNPHSPQSRVSTIAGVRTNHRFDILIDIDEKHCGGSAIRCLGCPPCSGLGLKRCLGCEGRTKRFGILGKRPQSDCAELVSLIGPYAPHAVPSSHGRQCTGSGRWRRNGIPHTVGCWRLYGYRRPPKFPQGERRILQTR